MLVEAKENLQNTERQIIKVTDAFLCKIFQPTRTRTYAISNCPHASDEKDSVFPDHVEITVSRKDMETTHKSVGTIAGVASGFLNPLIIEFLDHYVFVTLMSNDYFPYQ